MTGHGSLTIEKVQAFHLTFPTDQDMVFGVGSVRKRDMVLVKITVASGLIGYGEAHHARAPEAVCSIINHGLGPLVVGVDAMDRRGILHKMKETYFRSIGPGQIAIMAYSGIDIALWDVLGKALKLPAYQLMGAAKHSYVAYVGALDLGFRSAEAVLKKTESHIREGFTAIKLRFGQNMDQDLQNLAAVRREFGRDLKIMVDANACYTFHQALKVGDKLREHDVVWLEEPLPMADLQQLANLKSKLEIPIASGGSVYLAEGVRLLAESKSVDIIQADCTKTGGLTEWLDAAALAGAWNLSIAPHITPTPLAVASALHGMCAAPNAQYVEVDPPVYEFFRHLTGDFMEITNGVVAPTDNPGLGVEIDESMIDKYPGIPGPAYI